MLESRSGNREEFINMVQRCSAVGVNIYVDAVINHMTGIGNSGTGTGGSSFDGPTQEYPDFDSSNFHQPYCPVDVSSIPCRLPVDSFSLPSRFPIDSLIIPCQRPVNSLLFPS